MNVKSYTAKQLMTRRYCRRAKQLKEECEKIGINVYNRDSAESWYICVLSPSDYDIGERYSNTSECNNYFVKPDDYETAKEICDFL